jgi:hypothetical protein
VQNYDSRTEFVTTRQHIVPAPLPLGASTQPYQAFFVKVQGEGVWCPDTHYYVEYFGGIDLAGTPAAALCEPSVPNWHWHSCCGGVPPAMMEGPDKSPVFSARWTTRIRTNEATFYFSSLASGGSRIMLDETIVLDAWEEWGSTFTSDPVPTSAGYHILVYEYRSADTSDATPTNSYAVLTWTSEGASAATGASANYTEIVGSGMELYADIGWLACAPGTGLLNEQQLEAGFAPVASGSTTSLEFGARFNTVPIVFSTIISTSGLDVHLRLLKATEEQISIATEYDTCNFVINSDNHVLAWIITMPPTNVGAVQSAVKQQLTRVNDVTALLTIRESLGLPDDLQGHNGSDPCSDRWAGVECRAAAGKAPRVVVLDVSLIFPLYWTQQLARLLTLLTKIFVYC